MDGFEFLETYKNLIQVRPVTRESPARTAVSVLPSEETNPRRPFQRTILPPRSTPNFPINTVSGSLRTRSLTPKVLIPERSSVNPSNSATPPPHQFRPFATVANPNSRSNLPNSAHSSTNMVPVASGGQHLSQQVFILGKSSVNPSFASIPPVSQVHRTATLENSNSRPNPPNTTHSSVNTVPAALEAQNSSQQVSTPNRSSTNSSTAATPSAPRPRPTAVIGNSNFRPYQPTRMYDGQQFTVCEILCFVMGVFGLIIILVLLLFAYLYQEESSDSQKKYPYGI